MRPDMPFNLSKLQLALLLSLHRVTHEVRLHLTILLKELTQKKKKNVIFISILIINGTMDIRRGWAQFFISQKS